MSIDDAIVKEGNRYVEQGRIRAEEDLHVSQSIDLARPNDQIIETPDAQLDLEDHGQS